MLNLKKLFRIVELKLHSIQVFVISSFKYDKQLEGKRTKKLKFTSNKVLHILMLVLIQTLGTKSR